MTPDRWQRLKPLFEQAIERPAGERLSWVNRISAGDNELRADLLLLIEQHEQSGLLDLPAIPASEAGVLKAGDLLLHRFRILRWLGRGGMGEVYEAEDQELRERVAIKTIRPEITGNPQMLARFKQEIQLARKVRNRHVCRVNELFVNPDGGALPAFLTMEFLDGPTLSALLRQKGALPAREAEPIALQLCEALQAAHEEGVIHRDFKPGNIILVTEKSGSLRAVVTDFGLARDIALSEGASTVTAVTQAGAVIGTPAYMSPEQFQSRAVSPASDLYALGITLYEMLTGKHPFSGDTPLASAASRGHRPPAIHHRWNGVIQRCLEYEPERRFASARDVAAALRSHAAVTRRWLAAALVAILALAGFFLYRWRAGDHRPSPEAQHWYAEGTTALRGGTYLKATRALERALELDKNFVLAHARLADAWNELEFAGKAKDEMLKASAPESRLNGIDREYVEAVRATITRSFPAAVGRYKQILSELPQKEKAHGYVDLGRAHEKAGKIEDAIAAYATAAKLAPEYPASFVHLGILESRRKHSAEGEAAFAKAESLYRASSNAEGLAEIDYQRGYAANDLGKSADSRKYLEQSIQQAKAIPSVPLEIRAILQLSTIEYLSGSPDKSAALANQAIEMARSNGIEYSAMEGLLRLGSAYMVRGDYAKAEPYFREMLEFGRNQDRPRLTANANLSLANIRSQQGKPDEAIALAQAALDYYRPAGFFVNASGASLIIARAKRNRGQFREALQDALASLEASKKASSQVSTLRAEETVGNILLSLERYPEALQHFEGALAISREIGQTTEYQLLHCANALWRIGRYDEAEHMIGAAKQASKQSGPTDEYAELTIAHIQASRLQEMEVYQRASALQLKPGVSEQTILEARLLQLEASINLKRTARATSLCIQVMSATQNQPNPQDLALARMGCAKSEALAGDLAKAREFANTALLFFETSNMPDSEWRALLFLSVLSDRLKDRSARVRFAQKAVDILGSMEHNWETPTYKSYLSRPDVTAAVQELRLLGVA